MTNATPKHGWDRATAWVAVLAACASVISFLIYFRRGDILLFGDAVAHINIARRVFDSRTPGLLQLGTVWLPLPHLLMMPFLISKRLWQTGVGGSVPSMVAYVLGVTGIFRLVRMTVASSENATSGSGMAAWFAAAIFALNPNLLYVQATAMTESLYLALFIWSVVYFGEFVRGREDELRWQGTKRSLWKCGACLGWAGLTRYDGWFVAGAIAALVILCGWRAPGADARRTVVGFVLLAGAVPLLWFTYNAIVYRNPLEFANGPYSARAIERKTAVPGFPPHPGTNNLPVAAAYFVKAGEFSVAEGNSQTAWLGLALLGSVVVASKDRRKAPLLLLWLPVPFYMLSVAYGGVPIFTPAWWPHSLYNIRYGLQLLPALVVFVALAAWYGARAVAAKWVMAAIAVGFAVISYAGVWRAEPGCYREAWVNSRTRLQIESQLAEQLKRLPPDGSFLMYLGEHVGALQEAGIPLRRAISEGNHRVWKQPSDSEGLWERALANPAGYADFVVGFDGDTVWQAVHGLGLPVVARIEVAGQRAATIYRAR